MANKVRPEVTDEVLDYVLSKDISSVVRLNERDLRLLLETALDRMFPDTERKGE